MFIWENTAEYESLNLINNYFASQVRMPNQYGVGPKLTLEDQIIQKAKTGQVPMGLFPDGAKPNTTQ